MFANFDVTPSFLFTVLLACNKLQPSKTQDCSVSSPCQYGGTCVNNVCSCPPGLAGPTCSNVNCNDYPCFNRGTCIRGPPDMCICPSGYVQPFCTISCQNRFFSCVNGGCVDDVCNCPPNFAGPTCESAIFAYLNPVAVTVSEGNNDNDVTVQICRQPNNSAITLGVYTSSGSASSGSDYEHISFSQDVTIPAGQVCTTETVTIRADQMFEQTEEFSLVLWIPDMLQQSGYTLSGNTRTTITIMNDDPVNCDLDRPCFNGGTCRPSELQNPCTCPAGYAEPFCTTSCLTDTCQNGGACTDDVCSCQSGSAGPTCQSAIAVYLSPLEVSVTEGDTGNIIARIHLCRQQSSLPASVTVATSQVSAIASGDFVSRSTSVTISNGQVCVPVDISIVSDMTFELTEVFHLVILPNQLPSSVYIVPGQQSATITIIDNDEDTDPPVISNCPSDNTRSIAPGTSSTSVFWHPPTASDNSGDVTLTSSHQRGDTFFLGQTTVDYTATDGAGNTVLCQFVITVMIDIDECSIGSHTCDVMTSECMNAIGFYMCDCRFGYIGESYFQGQQPTCEDIDECSTGSHSCDVMTSECSNTRGSYRCDCRIGYIGESYYQGQQPTCEDIDECSIGSHICDAMTSECMNIIGFYRCDCRTGYIGESYFPGQQPTCEADVTPPFISGCPSDMFHTVEIGTTGMTVSWTEPSATDNSGTATLVSRSHSPGSDLLVGTTTVTYRYADPAGNEAVCTFDVIVQEDCMSLGGQCRPNECSCTKETCTPQTGRCEVTCSVYQCPANIASESLSQVNPQSSVEIKCILEGSTAVVNGLEIRLSRSENGLDSSEIVRVTTPNISTNRREVTYRVISVSEDDQFFCILSLGASVVGSINVTGFVYKLPFISDPPTEVTRTTTSVTITWRPWNEETDVGDPPVVAYIPYYRMDPSQDWMSGSRIQPDQTLEYAATSLESDRNYTFSVAAVRVGEGGEGPRGPAVTIKTLCIEVVPQMVTTTLTATNDVTVTWQQPTVQCSTGITQFTIYYEIEGDVSSRQEAGTADPNAETFTVDGSLLEPGTTYNIAVTVTTDQESALSEGLSVTATKPTGSSGSLVAIIIGVVIVVLIVLILLLLIFIVVRKRKMEDQPDPIYDQPLNDIGKQSGPSGSTDHSSGAVNMALNVTEVKKTKESAVASSSVPDEGGIYGNLEPPSPIKIADFPEYIVNNINKVEHEFGLLEGVQQKHPWTVAEEEFNRKKNRFRNMYPYDHCRVVLPKLPGDHSSDYYNASFILNARDERAYIASQAPNKASVDDFWRLIWEQNVQTIVMLANLYEATKERCLQYWPKEESETQSFGYIDVTWTKTQHFADYVIRTLSVKRDRTTRDIEQLHFKEWPDKDIPDNAMCLVEFARHCKLIHFKKQTPFLIHCSAGIGRTGTFIGLLSMMDVLQSEEYIDIFAFVNKMRENRVNMIQTKQQYRYLHTCLYEFHLTRDCQISAQSLSRFKIKDNKAAILREFQLLSEMERSMTTDSHKTGRTTDTLGRGSSSDSHETDWSMAREHAPRDRFGNMVPLERRKVFLISSSPSNPDNYINASFVKSYEKKDAFITTQSPLPNTIEDFWRMIYDHKCRTVVMLNQLDGEDKTCVQYWPNRGSLQYGIMTVTCIATEQHSDYVRRTFDVTLNNSANVISVTHLQLEDWPPNGSPQSLVRLITDAQKLQEEPNVEKPLVVHCINGFGRSGVFVTVQSEMERIRATGLVDIFATVKKLRNEHQHMMKKKMEYKLCFDFLIEFSKRYDNYENW